MNTAEIFNVLVTAGEVFMTALGWTAKVFIIVLAVILVIGFTVRLIKKSEKKQKKHIKVEDLGKQLESYYLQVKKVTTGKKTFETLVKKMNKKRQDQEKKNIYGPVAFLLDFKGDIKASQVDRFRDEVSTILKVADPKKDEVIVRIESPGGVVHGYGLAASQLKRIKDNKFPLTVCIDKVAASGGYMMACVADTILAAPFAIVGSIGVVFQLPNLHRFLKNKDIDYIQLTAGEYKRTVSLFGEISEKGKAKQLKDIEDMHKLFKEHVHTNRPSLDIDKVSTGEYWYGIRAKELNLVDQILTSDDYIAQLLKDNKRVFKVELSVQKNWIDKLGGKMENALKNSLGRKFFQKELPSNAEIPPHFPEHII